MELHTIRIHELLEKIKHYSTIKQQSESDFLGIQLLNSILRGLSDQSHIEAHSRVIPDIVSLCKISLESLSPVVFSFIVEFLVLLYTMSYTTYFPSITCLFKHHILKIISSINSKRSLLRNCFQLLPLIPTLPARNSSFFSSQIAPLRNFLRTKSLNHITEEELSILYSISLNFQRDNLPHEDLLPTLRTLIAPSERALDKRFVDVLLYHPLSVIADSGMYKDIPTRDVEALSATLTLLRGCLSCINPTNRPSAGGNGYELIASAMLNLNPQFFDNPSSPHQVRITRFARALHNGYRFGSGRGKKALATLNIASNSLTSFQKLIRYPVLALTPSSSFQNASSFLPSPSTILSAIPLFYHREEALMCAPPSDHLFLPHSFKQSTSSNSHAVAPTNFLKALSPLFRFTCPQLHSAQFDALWIVAYLALFKQGYVIVAEHLDNIADILYTRLLSLLSLLQSQPVTPATLPHILTALSHTDNTITAVAKTFSHQPCAVSASPSASSPHSIDIHAELSALQDQISLLLFIALSVYTTDFGTDTLSPSPSQSQIQPPRISTHMLPLIALTLAHPHILGPAWNVALRCFDHVAELAAFQQSFQLHNQATIVTPPPPPTTTATPIVPPSDLPLYLIASLFQDTSDMSYSQFNDPFASILYSSTRPFLLLSALLSASVSPVYSLTICRSVPLESILLYLSLQLCTPDSVASITHALSLEDDFLNTFRQQLDALLSKSSGSSSSSTNSNSSLLQDASPLLTALSSPDMQSGSFLLLWRIFHTSTSKSIPALRSCFDSLIQFVSTANIHFSSDSALTTPVSSQPQEYQMPATLLVNTFNNWLTNPSQPVSPLTFPTTVLHSTLLTPLIRFYFFCTFSDITLLHQPLLDNFFLHL